MITDEEYFRLQQVVANIKSKQDADRVVAVLQKLPPSIQRDSLLRNTLTMQTNFTNG